MLGHLSDALRRFLADRSGPTTVEYAVMLALIAAVCVTAVAALGTVVEGSLANSAERIAEAGQ